MTVSKFLGIEPDHGSSSVGNFIEKSNPKDPIDSYRLPIDVNHNRVGSRKIRGKNLFLSESDIH